MSLPKQPGWLRGLEVGAGLLSLMVAISIFVFPALGVATLVFLLAVGLIFAGARSVSDAEYGRLSKSVRVLGAISGALAIIMAVSVIIFHGLALLSLIVLLMVAFGITFEFPVLLVSLELAGVLTPRQLSSWRRWAIVSIVVLAGVITPSSDPFSMIAMAVPLYLFYELSIVVGKIVLR